MTRQANGTWLPTAGNPVVTGTVITSTWANALVPDIGSDIADSLSRSGKGSMLAPLKIEDGTIGAPALTFSAEPTTGLYRAAAGEARFSVLGVDNFRLKTGAAPAYWTGAAWSTMVTAAANNTFTGTNGFQAITATTVAATTVAATGAVTGASVAVTGAATSGTLAVSGTANFSGELQMDGVPAMPAIAASSFTGTTVSAHKNTTGVVTDGGSVVGSYRRIYVDLSQNLTSNANVSASFVGAGALAVPIIIGQVIATGLTSVGIDVIYTNLSTPALADITGKLVIYDLGR